MTSEWIVSLDEHPAEALADGQFRRAWSASPYASTDARAVASAVDGLAARWPDEWWGCHIWSIERDVERASGRRDLLVIINVQTD